MQFFLFPNYILPLIFFYFFQHISSWREVDILENFPQSDCDNCCESRRWSKCHTIVLQLPRERKWLLTFYLNSWYDHSFTASISTGLCIAKESVQDTGKLLLWNLSGEGNSCLGGWHHQLYFYSQCSNCNIRSKRYISILHEVSIKLLINSPALSTNGLSNSFYLSSLSRYLWSLALGGGGGEQGPLCHSNYGNGFQPGWLSPAQ